MIPEEIKYDYLISRGWEYNSVTGLVTTHKNNILKANKRGYIYTRIKIPFNDGFYWCNIYAHRFAYYYVTGELADVIHHKNHIRFDNRFENLENVTFLQNIRDRKKIDNVLIIQNLNGEIEYNATTYHLGNFRILGTFSDYEIAKNVAKEYKESYKK
jgi:hypothetical protein